MDKITLKDIHLPERIGWWPMASGKIALALLIVGISVGLLMVLIRYYMRGRARRVALKLLSSYEQQFCSDLNSQSSAACVSELLKRVALVYFPREKVASLRDEAWIAFLNETSKGLNFQDVRVALLELPYQRSQDHDLKPLFTMAEAWVKQRRGPCLS
ncbi:MAG: DUF4381 domain-containing protein [Legionellales bacterium]|nr:DUF4381 domain-containing protein [Legionellales bacterium]